MSAILITLVAAVARNGVIGSDGDMPWRLPSDLQRFKAYTMGKPIVMGRKTWQSFPRRPLPGRLNIVVTRKSDFKAEGAELAHSLDEAMAFARSRATLGEVCIIGGGEIYRQAFEKADRLVITHVLADIEGDTLFPDIDPQLWYEAQREAIVAGDKDSHDMQRVIYQRRDDA